MKYTLSLLVIAAGLAVGAAGIVHGQADDSPVLQPVGFLLVLATAVLGVRSVRGSSRHPGRRDVGRDRPRSARHAPQPEDGT